MKQLSLSKWLKTIIVGVGFCGLLIYLLILPYMGNQLVDVNSDKVSWYWPWLVFLWVTAIPCYLVLYCGWIISSEIGKDNSFSEVNANRLKDISILSGIDSAILFIGNVVFLLLNMNTIVLMGMSFIVIFFGIAVSVATAALSHLVYKAMEIEQENELTI